MRTRKNARRRERRGGGGDAGETKNDDNGGDPVDVGLELQAVVGDRNLSVEQFDDERSPSVTNPMYGRHSASVRGDALRTAKLEQRVGEAQSRTDRLEQRGDDAEKRADDAGKRADDAEIVAQQREERMMARMIELEQRLDHSAASGDGKLSMVAQEQEETVSSSGDSNDWETHLHEDTKRLYRTHSVTGESQWVEPTATAVVEDMASEEGRRQSMEM